MKRVVRAVIASTINGGIMTAINFWRFKTIGIIGISETINPWFFGFLTFLPPFVISLISIGLSYLIVNGGKNEKER